MSFDLNIQNYNKKELEDLFDVNLQGDDLTSWTFET